MSTAETNRQSDISKNTVFNGLCNLFAREDGHTPARTWWLVSSVLICTLFADVLFLRTSLAPIDYTDILKSPGGASPPASILPERPGRLIGDRQGDIGSAAFQFEPAILFLAHCLRSGESAYWDPYTATGTVGPETVVDMKFSAFSFAVALLGGSARVFSFVLLFLYVVSGFCVLRVCSKYLELSFAASIAAYLAYFLNGFALSNLYTAIGQPYFWAPILLLSCLAVSNDASSRNVAGCVLAHVCFYSTTFLPTAVPVGMVVYGLTFMVALRKGIGEWYRHVALISAIAIISAGLLGFLLGPVIAAHFSYLNDLNEYNARKTPGDSLINLISLFTPKHIWETYVPLSMPPGARPGAYERYIHYLGIAASLVAAHAISIRRRFTAPVVILLVLCFLASFGQAFGIFPFTLIDTLPFFHFIRNTYWGAVTAFTFAFLVGLGLDALSERNALSLPSLVLAGIISCAFFFAYGHAGLSDVPWEHAYISIFWSLLGVTAMLLYLTRLPRRARWTKPALVVLIFCEGLFYTNGLRPHREGRDVHPPPSITWLKSKIKDASGDRVLNIGETGMFPNWGAAMGIPELGDLNMGAPLWYRDFYQRYIGTGLFLSLAYPDNQFAFTDDSLSLTGVRYVIVDRTFAAALARVIGLGYKLVKSDSVRLIYENPHPLPRVFIVGSLKAGDRLPNDGPVSVRSSATTIDPILLAEARNLGISAAGAATSAIMGGSGATVTAYHHDFVQLQCDLQKAAVLVMTDAWTPWWTAYSDGRPIHLGRADMAFRAIALPAGKHVIEFRYSPLSLRIGKWITLGSAILLLFILARWARLRSWASTSLN